MDIDREDLDLAELADAAGVSPRTVRYYVQQGLLPSPGTRGPKTRYDRVLLERLQLIKVLQRQHLPLSEIRRTLESLDDDGVRRALAAPPERPIGDSALGYVRGVMKRSDSTRTQRADRGRPPRVAEHPDLFRGPQTASRATMKMMKSTWERVTLAPDVELHVRRPLSREQNKRLDKLLDAARSIFSEEP